MTKTKHIIFGGKGFIGQNLAQELALRGDKILIIDRDRWKNRLSYNELSQERLVTILTADINEDQDAISVAIDEFTTEDEMVTIWHLAANSDISEGNENIKVDLRDTFLTTVNILNYCKKLNLKCFYFSSSSAVYGDFPHATRGLKEDDATQPISNYGAMKLASEAVLRAAHQQFLKRCVIFRFPNVIGFPATHGVIYDFIKKLKKTPDTLTVLGDGNQNKPYLHVKDLISAMMHLDQHYVADKIMETINIGSPYENVFVKEIADEVRIRVSPDANIIYGDTPFGWVGDMPSVKFNIEKLLRTGWQCNLTGLQAVRKTIEENLEGNEL